MQALRSALPDRVISPLLPARRISKQAGADLLDEVRRHAVQWLGKLSDETCCTRAWSRVECEAPAAFGRLARSVVPKMSQAQVDRAWGSVLLIIHQVGSRMIEASASEWDRALADLRRRRDLAWLLDGPELYQTTT